MLTDFNKTRPPAVAGMFYPDDPTELKQQIDFYLNNLEKKPIIGELMAIVVPHAGYMYSGQVAAAAYIHLLDQEFDYVVIIAPSHREYFKGISVLPALGYSTPLRDVKIATSYCERLIEQNDNIIASWEGHNEEHALEVQLPFIQRVLGDFELIPIIMGDQTFDNCILLGEALVKVFRHQKTLIVASSDLSHYYPALDAEIKDKKVVTRINAFDYEGLWDDIESQSSEACGAGPIVAAMYTAKKRGANKSEVLLYQHSGNITGDHSAVVGYLSAAIHKG
ncbi:AmmeMemoRadiSam system protein B [candidate division KSB1 bacterium]|nr:AmmeMemoRadiSam system protein B [candidate division KSB1 bacterium]